MKILFLDVDGVLNRCGKTEDRTLLEPDKCTLLKQVCDQTACVIVVSSTWRVLPRMRERLHAMFRDYGIHTIGDTPDLSGPPGPGYSGQLITGVPRHKEITEYLGYTHLDAISSYAIVDDDSDADDGHGRFVKTDSYEGLTHDKAQEIIRILNPNP